MRLSDRDRGFLHEFTEAGWANHFVAAHCFLEAGSETSGVAREWAKNQNSAENQTFLGLTPVDPDALAPRIQKLCALRIWQEYFAAFEDAAVFLRAVGHRDLAGLLRAMWKHDTVDIPAFYDKAADHRVSLGELLALPSRVLDRWPPSEWCRERLFEVAIQYNRHLDHVVVPLSSFRDVASSDVLVMLRVNPHGVADAESPTEKTLRHLLNKLKHGFLAATTHSFYTTTDPNGIWVLPLSAAQPTIHGSIENIELVGRICWSLGRLLLDGDERARRTESL